MSNIANLSVSIGSRQYKSTNGKPRQRSAAAKIKYILRRARHRAAQDLMHSRSGNMPHWAQRDPMRFWEAADKHERKNGTLFVEHLLVLPRDLTLEQHIELVEKWAESEAKDRAFTYAIHYSKSADGGINPHCHFVLNESLQDGIKRGESQFFKRYNAKHPERGGCKKGGTGARTLAENKQDLLRQRQLFEDLCNEALEQAQKETRVSLQSYKNRGLSIVPEPKVGPRGWQNETIRKAILAIREAKNKLIDELARIKQSQVMSLDRYRAIKKAKAELERKEVERRAQEKVDLLQWHQEEKEKIDRLHEKERAKRQQKAKEMAKRSAKKSSEISSNPVSRALLKHIEMFFPEMVPEEQEQDQEVEKYVPKPPTM